MGCGVCSPQGLGIKIHECRGGRGGSELGLVMNVENPRYVCVCVYNIYITLYIYKSTPLYSHFASDHLFLSGPTYQSSIKWQTQTSKNGLRVGYREGGGTSVSPYREIGLARNVEVKISKMFQKVFKLKF